MVEQCRSCHVRYIARWRCGRDAAKLLMSDDRMAGMAIAVQPHALLRAAGLGTCMQLPLDLTQLPGSQATVQHSPCQSWATAPTPTRFIIILCSMFDSSMFDSSTP
jgi:hypothetical protein